MACTDHTVFLIENLRTMHLSGRLLKRPYSFVSKKHNHEDTKQSTAKGVTVYLDEVPPERKAALGRLRDLCRTSLQSFEESMRYGGPCYSRHGEVEVGFASQKNFIGLYILRTDVMNAHRDLLKVKGVSLGKGCIRYWKPEKIEFQGGGVDPKGDM